MRKSDGSPHPLARIVGLGIPPFLHQLGEITVAALRDQLGSSRKFALTVLEYLDIQHVTRRIGDKRVLARP